ncbi:MAG: hypothetical protein GY755_00150, partial [Chloroflexi bacterium]|nr:hypothetical protein [Chloroflexota bacterium]
QYSNATESGNNSGQVTTWTSAEYAALASMDPGDILTMDITATVIACDNLDNIADVRFGCNPSPNPQKYIASFLLQLKNPVWVMAAVQQRLKQINRTNWWIQM